MRLNYIDNIDCLEGLAEIPDNSVDLIVTDPPYMINNYSSMKGKIDPWADWCNAAYWYTKWMQEAKRVLKDSGAMWTFLNWRSMVTFQKAACNIDWLPESLLVWDKGWMGPGGQKGLRPSYELVMLFAKPSFKIPNRGLADIQQFKWSSVKPHGHPAEKPEALIRWLIEQSSGPGAVVLDTFMGSGTTAVACLRTGRNFIGFEMNPEFHAIAQGRIAEEVDRLLEADDIQEDEGNAAQPVMASAV